MSSLGRYELLYNGRVLAEAWWLHELAYPAVTMTRLVDRLNLPASECAPSTSPTWSLALLPQAGGEGSVPAAWGVFSVDGRDALHVVWLLLPLRLDEWHQRLLDGLNAGRGLPAVRRPDGGGACSVTTYEGETLGTAVAGISAYVDAKIGYEISVRELAWERIGKIAEEYGEVTEAWIGVGATNPRKGATHSYDDVRSELLDVAVAALGAWEHLSGNRGQCGFALLQHAISRAVRLGALS